MIWLTKYYITDFTGTKVYGEFDNEVAALKFRDELIKKVG